QHVVTAIDSHTAGEPTRILTGGFPHVPGQTMADKRAWLRANLDHLRTGLVHEPRGHDAIVLAFLLPPVEPDAHAGVVFANDVGYLGMCGHGAIGVATALVALGMVPARAPETEVVLDTPAGVVRATVVVRDGAPRSVRLRNVPSFLWQRDVEVPVDGVGRVRVDIAYGGNWFAIVREDELDVSVEFDALPELMARATAVRAALEAQGIAGFDPHTGERHAIDHVEVFRALPGPGHRARTLTLCPGSAYDRSPCGTGTSAKLAVLCARGELRDGDAFVNESILGTEFTARVVGTADVA